MSSSRRKFLVRHPVVVDIGCSCRRAKLSSLFSSSSYSVPKPKAPKSPDLFSPSTTTTTSNWETSLTFTTSATPTEATSSPSLLYSAAAESPMKKSSRSNKKKKKKKKQGVIEQSVAVEKDSSDPYLDFRDSMLHMIVEKEIYAWEDLRDLLHRFLSLNSPHHHHLILRAFAEIWNGVFSQPFPSPSPSPSSSRPRVSRR